MTKHRVGPKVRSTGPQPGLNPKIADFRKRALMVGHKRMAKGEGEFASPELTGNAGIQLNALVSLRCGLTALLSHMA